MKQFFAAPLAAALVLGAGAPAYAWNVTWLGHAGFVIEAKDGTRVLVDPWLKGPTYPKGYNLPAKVDAILVSHGHFDHAGSATELSQKFKAPIVGCFELVSQLQPKGIDGMGGNAGGTVQVKGISISMVGALHSSSLDGADGKPAYAGAPLGFVLQAKGEPTLYHAGDTGLTHDFMGIRDAYHPQIAMLPIGGHFTLDPKQAAIAASWLGVKKVVPMHFGTFGLLKGTPAQLRSATGAFVKVYDFTPGKPQVLK
jgi:L-ascorbate metabolism protein UlaG (beta-lactamase superfamily)